MSARRPEELHVRPLNDSAEHRDEPECWCEPEAIIKDDAIIWVHRSGLELSGPRVRIRSEWMRNE